MPGTIRKPVDLPTRLPWPAGTKASITQGYGEEVVPGHWAACHLV